MSCTGVNFCVGLNVPASARRRRWPSPLLQQSFPLSQSLLLIPLALEGHTGADPHGCTKVAIAGERENAFRQRFTVTRRDRKAATVLLQDASDLPMFGRPAAMP